MKFLKTTILFSIVLLIMADFSIVHASFENKQEYKFYLNNKENYFFKDIDLNPQKIYPGSSGYFDIIVNTKSYSFNINYCFKIFNLKNKPQNLYFIIDNKKITDLDNYIVAEGYLEKGKEELIKRIQWRWDFEADDTVSNQNDFTFKMELKVERKENSFGKRKMPRTGFGINLIAIIVLSIFSTVIYYRLLLRVRKENNEINRDSK